MSLVLPDPTETALELNPVKLRVMIENTRRTIVESSDIDELRRYEKRCTTITSLIRESEDLADCAFDIQELQIDIKRRIGVVRATLPKNPGGRKSSVSGGSPADPVSEAPSTVAEQGLTKREAQQTRDLAVIPDEIYAEAKRAGREKGKLSATQVIRDSSSEPEPNKLANLKPTVRMVEGHAVCNDFDLGPEVVLRGAIRLADKAEQKLGDWLRKLVAQTVADSAGRTVKKP